MRDHPPGIRRPGATAGTDARPPGVLFLQVDGLGHDTLRRTLRTGEMPVFSRWLAEGSHALTHWNTDWSSQTGAGVCGILHGSSAGILGFRWYEKDTDHVMACSDPEDAAEIERRHSTGAGLLAGDGAGRGNLFTGDAPYVSLTMSAVPLLAGRGRAAAAPTPATRSTSRARPTPCARWRPRWWRSSASCRRRSASAAATCARGWPAACGSRSCGPAPTSSPATSWCRRSSRTCSTAGGDPSPSPVARGRSEKGWQAGAVLAEASAGGGFAARRLRVRVERARAAEDVTAVGEAHGGGEEHRPGGVARVAPGVAAVASGHMAMVSFPDVPGRVELETIERLHPDLLPGLVDHPGIGFVLVRSAEHGPVVLGRDGLHRLATGVVLGADPLLPCGPHAAELVRRVDAFPNCCDIMVNSRFDPATEDAPPFEPHVGSQGGLGGPQSRGFLLHPAGLPAPEQVLGGEIVGSEDLHRVLRAWLTHLGHPVPEPR